MPLLKEVLNEWKSSDLHRSGIGDEAYGRVDIEYTVHRQLGILRDIGDWE